jgi:para-aminobenzoate synthetase / 4-amino-4-deoxychorismate lyase
VLPPEVRLDSFDPRRGPRSFRFGGLAGVRLASRVDQVAPLLAEIGRAVEDGLHAVGYVAYEAAPAFDSALATHPPDGALPLAWFALYRERIEAHTEPAGDTSFSLGDWRADTGEAEYRDAFHRIRELIAAGDSYQVNYTFRLEAAFAGDPRGLYARLCRAQRSAFCAYLDLGSHAIVSTSPELFFEWRGGELTLRPMKGTRPRGRWPEEDEALAAQLPASPKERAENLMIVDLLRNDAGRVAVPGSVWVERMFEVERYDTVHQMTSTIRARTRPEVALAGVLGALFPCGSVTGAPKVRSMEIIRDLERGPRGVYCGAIGMVSPGEAVFSVAIRTVVVDRAAGTAELRVGSGVTWDARADEEYRECLGKAAFAHGDAPQEFELLETLRWEPGAGYLLLDGHLRRLEQSARRFGFAFDRRSVIEVLRAVSAAAPLRVRLTLAREGTARVQSRPLPVERREPRVALAADPVDSRDPLLFLKTTRREGYDRRRATRPDCDDVLLVNERGELTESTIANLVLRLNGALVTPPRPSGLLPGVFRGELLRLGEITERVLTPDDLQAAEEVWLVSSLRRWRRAVLAGPLA